MRIGFDSSPLVRPHPPGVVRLVASALDALEREPGLVALRLQPTPRENLRVWRQLRLPQLVAERGLSGLHSFVSAFALAGGGRRVQTIHELPWRQGAKENAGLRHRFWAAIASRRADRVVCASRFVAEQLARGSLAERVRVCPWGVEFERFAAAPQDEAALRVARRLEARPDAALVFAPGAVRAKKNLAALLRGLEELRRRGRALPWVAVSGAISAETERDRALARRLGLESQVLWLGALDETDYLAWLARADAVSVLSLSEGFGLPVLEAFARGTSVLVAKPSSQAEVADGLGSEVDAQDARSVAEGLERALIDTAPREARIARAKHLSWQRCARRLAEIWGELR